jgi:hypothetical protein
MSALSDELTNDPLARGYAQYIPDNPGMLAQMLTAPDYTMVKTKFVTARGVLAEHGSAGATVLDKIDAAGSSDSAVKWAMKFVTSEPGIDVGHPTTRSLLNGMVPAVLTQAEADMLLDMAVQPASRAEVLGIGYVSAADVQAALGQ